MSKKKRLVSDNLISSWQACNYVLNQVKMKAPNWAHQWEGQYYCKNVENKTGSCKELGEDRDKIKKLITNPECKIGVARLRSEVAKMRGVGNCGEMSATAFIYLDNNSVHPLDWMILLPLEPPLLRVDHAFVVIGREPGTKADDYENWGPNAVICDPWAQGYRKNLSASSYKAKEFERRMKSLEPRFRGVKSICRVDPLNTVHIVRAGESLSKIAKAHYGDAEKWKRIHEANRSAVPNPDLIRVGLTLKIPTLLET